MKKLWGVYFSPTGTTKQIVTVIANELGECCECDFTPVDARQEPLVFEEDDIVIFGMPVYAGRVPNVLLRYLETIKGNNALVVPVVVYGNRDFDDALIELRDILIRCGLRVVGAAAFVAEHSFSFQLAKGRPDEQDMITAKTFAGKVKEKISGKKPETVQVDGVSYPYRGYYVPRDREGNKIDFRKIKPLTNEACDICGVCAEVCPMGSILKKDVHTVVGICIKCGACVKKCPKGAKYFGDEGYLHHLKELEETYTKRNEPRFFL